MIEIYDIYIYLNICVFMICVLIHCEHECMCSHFVFVCIIYIAMYSNVNGHTLGKFFLPFKSSRQK